MSKGEPEISQAIYNACIQAYHQEYARVLAETNDEARAAENARAAAAAVSPGIDSTTLAFAITNARADVMADPEVAAARGPYFEAQDNLARLYEPAAFFSDPAEVRERQKQAAEDYEEAYRCYLLAQAEAHYRFADRGAGGFDGLLTVGDYSSDFTVVGEADATTGTDVP